MKNVFTIIFLLILVSSCVSKLEVVVEAADRQVVLKEAEQYVKADVERGITALENFYYNWNEDAILEQMFNYIENEDRSTLLQGDRDIYSKTFKDTFDYRIKAIKDLTEIADKSYKTNKNYEALSNINLAGKVIFEIQAILQNYEVKTDNLGNHYIDIEPKSVKQASTAVSGSARTKFPILGDPMVSFLTKKENKTIWKSCYNKTVSSNFFGNADIAVILRTNPPENELKSGDYNNNFTLKGVRLDASDATNTLLTGLTQTINFIANTQGIPLNVGQQQDQNFPVPVQNTLVTGLNDDKNTLELKKKKLADYKKMLVEKIVSEKIDGRTGTDLTAAILRIETFWTTLKAELIK